MSYQEAFSTLDLNELERWVSTQRQEDLHLDFKLLSSGADLSRDDKKNLAKAISGFANSDGGLIVWGVDCRKDTNNVDAACGLKPVANVAAVLSRLQSLTGEATSPIVDGVQHRIIHTHDGSGFIATLVPASDSGPHMARGGEQRYYKRSGDSFYQMEHFDIADMFGRRIRPQLRLRLDPKIGPTSERETIIEIVASIENKGRGIARFPMMQIKLSAPYQLDGHGLDGNKRTGLPMRVRPAQEHELITFAGGSNDVVHPGTELQVALITHHISNRDIPDDDFPNDDPPFPDLVVEYTLAAGGTPAEKGQARIAGSTLLDLAKTARDRATSRSLFWKGG